MTYTAISMQSYEFQKSVENTSLMVDVVTIDQLFTLGVMEQNLQMQQPIPIATQLISKTEQSQFSGIQILII